MTGPTTSLCILCHDRPDELRRAISSASDFDEIVVCDMASEPAIPPADGTVWIRSDTNEGVAAGRNALAARASVDILVFLDDDVISFCAQLDPEYKLHGLTEKWILRQVAARTLPPQIANRPKTMFRSSLSKTFLGPDRPPGRVRDAGGRQERLLAEPVLADPDRPPARPRGHAL